MLGRRERAGHCIIGAMEPRREDKARAERVGRAWEGVADEKLRARVQPTLKYVPMDFICSGGQANKHLRAKEENQESWCLQKIIVLELDRGSDCITWQME